MSATRADTWMPFYWGDYLKDTLHLKAEGHGAYMLLIAQYWVTGKPLPANDDYLMAVARVEPKSWARLKPMISAFFVVTECEWIHPRIDRELAKAVEITKKRSVAGKAGANAKANAKANADQVDEQSGQQTVRHSQSHSPSPEFKNSFSEGNGKRIGPLKASTIEKAREIAPRYDLYHIENCFREFNAGKTIIDVDKAFLGFVRTHVERNPLQ